MGRKTLTLDIVNERLLGRGISMIGEYVDARTRSVFQCGHGHTWAVEPRHVLLGTGCPHCAEERRIRNSLSKETINQRLLDRDITMVSTYHGYDHKTEFHCKDRHVWLATPHRVLRGDGCPHCSIHGFNPNKPAWVYGWTRSNYLKIGITNDLQRRLDEHRKYGDINLVYECYYPVGSDAKAYERQFKKTHGGRHATKEECPDGYTETFPLSLIEILV